MSILIAGELEIISREGIDKKLCAQVLDASIATCTSAKWFSTCILVSSFPLKQFARFDIVSLSILIAGEFENISRDGINEKLCAQVSPLQSDTLCYGHNVLYASHCAIQMPQMQLAHQQNDFAS